MRRNSKAILCIQNGVEFDDVGFAEIDRQILFGEDHRQLVICEGY